MGEPPQKFFLSLQTLNPKPQTPKAETLNLKPQTKKAETLNPKPQTQKQKP